MWYERDIYARIGITVGGLARICANIGVCILEDRDKYVWD